MAHTMSVVAQLPPDLGGASGKVRNKCQYHFSAILKFENYPWRLLILILKVYPKKSDLEVVAFHIAFYTQVHSAQIVSGRLQKDLEWTEIWLLKTYYMVSYTPQWSLRQLILLSPRLQQWTSGLSHIQSCCVTNFTHFLTDGVDQWMFDSFCGRQGLQASGYSFLSCVVKVIDIEK